MCFYVARIDLWLGNHCKTMHRWKIEADNSQEQKLIVWNCIITLDNLAPCLWCASLGKAWKPGAYFSIYYCSYTGGLLNRIFIFVSQSWLHSLSKLTGVSFMYGPCFRLLEILSFFPLSFWILLPPSNGTYIEIGD